MTDIKQEILRHIDIVTLVSSYVALKKKGTRYWGLCPFHEEKTPSFCVTPEKDLYYCFGCRKGGDLFSFLMEVEKCDFIEALQLLAEKTGVEYRPQSGTGGGERTLKELYSKVSGSLHYLLVETREGERSRRYLESRGITAKTIEKFSLGYAPNNSTWLCNFLESKGYSVDFLRRSGLFVDRNGSLLPFFWNRVIFPIGNLRGDVLAFGGRALSDTGPKYINSPETPIFHKGDNLFGIRHAIPAVKKEEHFIIVEGYMDVLALHEAGIENCVAPLGTALTAAQAKMLKRYADRALLLFDGDPAGENAAVKAISLLEGMGISAEALSLPLGSDPADIVGGEGGDALRKAMGARLSGFDFLLSTARKTNSTATPEGKESTFRSLLPFLRAVPSEVKREAYFSRLAEALDVDIGSIRRDFAMDGRSVPDTKKDRPKDDTTLSDELFLMIAVAANLEYFSEVRSAVSSDDLRDEKARQIYYSLEDCFRKGLDSLEDVLERLEDLRLKQQIMEKVSSEEMSINAGSIIEDAVDRIRKRKLIEKRQALLHDLKGLKGSDPATIEREKELQTEIIILNDQLTG